MGQTFTEMERVAAQEAAERGLTHMIAWGRSNAHGYEVDVYSLPALRCIHSGYTNRKSFRTLDRATGMNLQDLMRWAKTVVCS